MYEPSVAEALKLGRSVHEEVHVDAWRELSVEGSRPGDEVLGRVHDDEEVEIREEIAPAPGVGPEEDDASDLRPGLERPDDPSERLVERLDVRRASARKGPIRNSHPRDLHAARTLYLQGPAGLSRR